jgi:hypothetical protein
VRAPFNTGRVAFTKIWDGCLAVIHVNYTLGASVNAIGAAGTQIFVNSKPFTVKRYRPLGAIIDAFKT